MKRPVNEVPAEILSLTKIVDPPKTERGTKREIEALADDIRAASGLLFPIIVRASLDPSKSGCYEILDGKRRYSAAKFLEWRQIKAVVLPAYLTEPAAIKKFVALVCACQRSQLSDYDIGHAANEVENRWQIRRAQFAEILGISAGYTYNLARWYSKLPEEILSAWKNGDPNLRQVSLERMSHMSHPQALAFFETLKKVRSPEPFSPGRKPKTIPKPRRASETDLLKLQEGIEKSPLKPAVRDLLTNVIRYAIGVSREVPGITDYTKLSNEIIATEDDQDHPDKTAGEVAAA